MSDIGRVIIATEAAIRKLGFRSDEERQAFCETVCKSVDEHMRQKLLTFRSNRVSSKA
jgi:hypothetical protein